MPVVTPTEGSDLASQQLVLVVVGTDHHPFSRLVEWMDRWARQHPQFTCFVQFGTSAAPLVCAGTDFLAHPDLQARMGQAAAVVSHGGPGTIMEMRASGHVPVVVPRDPALGEHVDSHQLRFARVVADRGMIRLALSEADLAGALDAALSAGRSHPAATARSGAASSAARTFGALIEERLRTPTAPAGWRARVAAKSLRRRRS